jgi:hypothetical protein
VNLTPRINRLKREIAAPEDERPPVFLLVNNPEAVRLGFDLKGEREAIVAGEFHRAEATESTKAFHHRLCAIARSRNVCLVSVGSDQPVLESRYNLDGSPVTLN